MAVLQPTAYEVARRFGIVLEYPPTILNTLSGASDYLPNASRHFCLTLLELDRNKGVFTDLEFGQAGGRRIYYVGATLPSDEERECLYIGTPEQIVSATWGFPAGVGVLEAVDLQKSRVLAQLGELRTIQYGPGTGNVSGVITSQAPAPENYGGVSQFSNPDPEKISKTIESILL